MHTSSQLAKHLRDVHFGGNWTVSCYKEHLQDVTWEEAITKVGSFNTIAVLVYHAGYFVNAVREVLQGKPLNAHDKYSFDHPPITSAEDWQRLLDKTWHTAEETAGLIEQVPEQFFMEPFTNPKYGNYYRNLLGIVEHLHYHLGQIVLIKKMIRKEAGF